MSEKSIKINLAELSDDEIDALLMAELNEHWQKMARLIACMNVYDEWSFDKLHVRIKALIASGKIESAGNIDEPRFSEVRIPIKVGAGRFGKGIVAFSKKDFSLALQIFEPLALKGEGGASYRIGRMYAHGLGIEQDKQAAKKWFQKALEQGFLPAQERLDELKDDGETNGVK